MGGLRLSTYRHYEHIKKKNNWADTAGVSRVDDKIGGFNFLFTKRRSGQTYQHQRDQGGFFGGKLDFGSCIGGFERSHGV